MPETTHTTTTPSSDISKALALRHGERDRICVGIYQRNGDGEFHLQQNFVDGIDAAQQVVMDHYLLPDVGAIWSNLQKLQATANARTPENIEAYTNLLIDIDRRDKDGPLLDAQGKPVLDKHGKPKLEHINATEAERAVLLEQSYGVIKFLKSYFGRPVHADSGNGYHLAYPLASLAPEIGHEHHETILKIIKAKFERPDLNIAIDTTISNHTRVITVWNTWNRKYPHTEERPQRQTRIISPGPKNLKPLSEAQLDLFCLENALSPKTGSKKPRGDWPEVDSDWLENYGVEHLCEWGMPYTPLMGESYEKGGETHYRLGNCITSDKGTDGFYEHHQGSNDRQTELILGRTLGIKCFSDDCDGVTIKDWRRRLEELKEEKYPHRIFKDDGPELVELFGAEAPEEVREEVPSPTDQTNRDHWQNKAATGGFTTIRASKVKDRAVEWLWKGRLPRGCGLVVSGAVCTNKSMFVISLAATVTTGKDWPDDEKNDMGPREVLIAATEDDLETTIVPRLKAADADLDKIHYLANSFDVEDGKYISRSLNISEDIFKLKEFLKANPSILLVILDPLTGFFGDVDGNDNKKIRPMMQAIARVCQETGVAFVLLIHENKRSDTNAVDKILGAGSVSQVIRAGVRISKDPKNKPDGRKFANIKGNLSRDNGGMNFSVGSKNVPAHDGQILEDIGYIVWGDKHAQSADDVMDEERQAKKEGGFDTKLEAAKAFIRIKFSQNWEYKCDKLYEEAGAPENGSIGVDTLKRARAKLIREKDMEVVFEDRRRMEDGGWERGGWWWICKATKTRMAGEEVDHLQEAI